MDFEEVVNFTNMTFDEDQSPYMSVPEIIQEVFFTIFVGIGILTNLTAIYTINHFKKLRTVTNLLFSNWALADSLSSLSNPSSFRLISVIENIGLNAKFVCIIMQTDFVFHNVATLFISMIAIDWLIASYFQSAIAKFRRCCKFLVVTIWCLGLIACIVTIRLCLRTVITEVIIIFLFFNFLVLILLMIFIHIFRGIQKCKKVETSCPPLMLIISTTYTICWFVGLLNFFNITMYKSRILDLLFEYVVFCSAIINFVLMCRYNKDFQACLIQLFKRSRDRYSENITEFEVYERNANVPSHNTTN